MKRDMHVFLQDILESISKIEEYTKNIDKEEFKENSQVQDAVIRRFEIIGEAVKNIPEPIRNKYPKIPWKNIAGLRDVLTHAYFGVNIDRTWKVVEENLEPLKEEIEKIKKDIDSQKHANDKNRG